MDDRRKDERKNARTFFAVLDRKTEQMIGCLVDISRQGFRLASEKEIKVGGILQLKLVLPAEFSGSRYITFDATCVWSKQEKNGSVNNLGFKFVNIARSEVRRVDSLLRSSLFREYKAALVEK